MEVDTTGNIHIKQMHLAVLSQQTARGADHCGCVENAPIAAAFRNRASNHADPMADSKVGHHLEGIRGPITQISAKLWNGLSKLSEPFSLIRRIPHFRQHQQLGRARRPRLCHRLLEPMAHLLSIDLGLRAHLELHQSHGPELAHRCAAGCGCCSTVVGTPSTVTPRAAAPWAS